MYPTKYALTIYERSPDHSLTINTHTGEGMRMLAGCQTDDDYLALAFTWYDPFLQERTIMGSKPAQDTTPIKSPPPWRDN